MCHLFSAEGLTCLQSLVTTPSVLIFDFDGTLAPIVSDPAQAKVSEQIASKLVFLSQSWPIAVLTGRSVEDVRNKLGFTPDYLFGNHGAERAGHIQDCNLRKKLDPCREFLSVYSTLFTDQNIKVEDKGLSLALHFRESPNPEAARAWLHELLKRVSKNIVISDGHMVINIVAMYTPDKGGAVLTIMQESGSSNALVVGDDENDESAFIVAPEYAATVRIGSPEICSRARFRLTSQQEIEVLLDILVVQKNMSPFKIHLNGNV